MDENDDVASKYSQFKNYLPNMEVPDLKIKYWRFFSYKIFYVEKIGFFRTLCLLRRLADGDLVSRNSCAVWLFLDHKTSQEPTAPSGLLRRLVGIFHQK